MGHIDVDEDLILYNAIKTQDVKQALAGRADNRCAYLLCCISLSLRA